MKSIFKLIGWLFKLMWLTLNYIRLFIVNGLFVLVVIVIVLAVREQQVPMPIPTPQKAPLMLELNGQLVEQAQLQHPMAELSRELTGEKRMAEIDLNQLIYTLDHAKSDPNVTGLILEMSNLVPASLTKLGTIGESLEAFRESGKPIIAIGDHYQQHQYYLASFADEIVLNPQGAVMLRGFASQRLYFKDALDKLSINTHVFRVGTHKSFVEPYTRNQMSPEAKEDMSRWMTKLWERYTHVVASNREIPAQRLAPSGDAVIKRLRAVDGNAAQYALANGLVDKLLTRSEERQYLIDTFGKSNEDDSYARVYLDDYIDTIPAQYSRLSRGNEIALLVAQGPIVGGEGTSDVIAAETILEQLDTVLDDDDIRALVLRVDSPGGSAFASELIRVKLADIQAAGKPVVVSMATTAASGGYWISATADRIFASETTITGSIGIFGLFATLEESLAKLGINSDGLATTSYASISPFQPLPDQVSTMIQLNVENGYHQFVNLVSDGRQINLKKLDKLAQGRIWTGEEALENGLVDQLGELDDAITYTADTLGLEKYSVTRILPKLSPRDQLIAKLIESRANSWLSQSIPFWTELTQAFQSIPNPELFNDPQGRYLFCETCGEI